MWRLQWSRLSPCSPGRTPCWSRFILKDCSPWEGPMLEQGKSVRRIEWQRLSPHSHVPLGGGEVVKESEMKEWSRTCKKKREGVCFNFILHFSPFKSTLTGKNKIKSFFPKSGLFCLWWWVMSLSLSRTMRFFNSIFPPCPTEDQEWGSTWVIVWPSTTVNPPPTGFCSSYLSLYHSGGGHTILGRWESVLAVAQL